MAILGDKSKCISSVMVYITNSKKQNFPENTICYPC